MVPQARTRTRPAAPPARVHPIESYGLIGNNRTALLVSPRGSIDWAAFPRFDSPTVFAALLDPRRGGYFSIDLASGRGSVRRHYVPGTTVLVTELADRSGSIALEDFCPEIDSDRVLMSEVHRRLLVREGAPKVAITFAPRFAYGAATPSLRRSEHGILARGAGGSIGLSFDPDERIELAGDHARGELALQPGEERWFVLSAGAEEVTPLGSFHAVRRRRETERLWRAWARRMRYEGRWRPEVERSALTLKTLFYRPSGAMVAAPTTSLPEAIGGRRNWDYRFCWVRDTVLAVRALFDLGYTEEATDFVYWLLDILEHEEVHLKVLYAVDGGAPPTERTVPSLHGYRGSRPVRVGNAARDQVQHDLYGGVLAVADLLEQHGGVVSLDLWWQLRRLVEYAARVWSEPDHGIWEVRGPPRHYVYSKAMSWAALDRGIDLGERLGYPAPFDRWRRTRAAIAEDVLARGRTARGGALAWYYGANGPDASLLRLPILGFLAADDPVMVRTADAIEESLVDEPFVRRYRLADGLAGGEGYFLPCAFWRVAYYARRGERGRARRIFERLLARAGPLGLYGEEIDAKGRHLGNFPQAFTHLALITAATELDRALDVRERGPAAGSRAPDA
ncbi:MAG TPA: glycoside hydrolase family 15 protein [Thermoplasmata archaeon]|nr:glycoside hydrolase family 15 protein [Thermoplasmata archaeon]